MVDCSHDSQLERARMVREQLEARGICDPAVLRAMGRVPREHFVEEAMSPRAYGDHPLPIGHGQTIPQPFMVAYVAQLLRLSGRERVLDVGAGSGYQAAVLADLVPDGAVYAVERIPQLAALAARRLLELGYSVEVCCGDGSLGWAEYAPFDAIVVDAAVPRVPEELLAQLADGGRLVVPVGDQSRQRLLLIERRGDQFDIRPDIECVYVDLVGRYGWDEGLGERPFPMV
ncbi:MAG: protein-L-isoaspartate(D-aspartate) O-methyltransferase [Myxococcales bacterium]|nr:protein-L-isoaspartate(D-aspartate) O-methyltransferase [Myxococcota bacterium]MDW8282885.1 protein-L-isoaspartate(D-aspartate) O-methyltransferase [Myxococcales bacterium]